MAAVTELDNPNILFDSRPFQETRAELIAQEQGLLSPSVQAAQEQMARDAAGDPERATLINEAARVAYTSHGEADWLGYELSGILPAGMRLDTSTPSMLPVDARVKISAEIIPGIGEVSAHVKGRAGSCTINGEAFGNTPDVLRAVAARLVPYLREREARAKVIADAMARHPYPRGIRRGGK